MVFTVYKHTNIKTGKAYIGFTSRTMQSRWLSHLSDARRRPRMCRAFCNAIIKYGEDCWTHEILFEGEDRKEALAMEEKMISLHKTQCHEHGYNIGRGGEATNVGHKRPAEHCKKQSARQTGKGNPCYGRVYSDEEKQRISKQVRERYAKNRELYGTNHPPSAIKKMKESHAGEKNPFHGKKHTKATRLKMSKNSGAKGKTGWNHHTVRANAESMAAYAMADQYYDWWKENSRARAKRLANKFEQRKMRVHEKIIELFFSGWNPSEDADWINEFR